MMPNKELPTVQTLQEIHPENESKWWTSLFSINKWAVYSSHRTIWALPCIVPIFGLKWAGNAAHGSQLPPRPQMEMECVLRAARRGAAVCQVTALCWYILLSSIMMWWPPLMKCMLSAGDLENKRSSAAREVAGLERGVNANQTFASVAFSALEAADSQTPEASPAVWMTPLSVRSSSSLPFLFFFCLLHLFLTDW